MEWIKLQLHVIRSEQYIGCEPVQRASYIGLLAYCVDQENSGIIKGCASWNDRKWMQLCGLLKSEVVSCDLFWYEGDDIHVYAYTMDQQRMVENKREKGRINAEIRWNKAKGNGSPIEPPIEQPNADKTRLDKTNKTKKSRAKKTKPEWQTQLESIGCGHVPSKLENWKRILDLYGIELITEVCQDLKASNRWDNVVESACAEITEQIKKDELHKKIEEDCSKPYRPVAPKQKTLEEQLADVDTDSLPF